MPLRIFGWVAGGLGVIYNIPQIYRLYKRKTAGDISLVALVVRIAAYICYVLHAMFIQDPPLLWMTVVSLLQCFLLFVQVIYYGHTIAVPELATS